MAIEVRVAQTDKELKDVYKLRYRVYVQSEGYFKKACHDLITDKFDTVEGVGNVVAYHEGEAIGTMRANIDSEAGLPAEQIFDFSECRKTLADGYPITVRFGGAGMLAIDEKWRNRRDVFKALISACCAFGAIHGATHILATVNKKSLSIYRKLGYQILDDAIWVEEIGEYVLPVSVELAKLNLWAFGVAEPTQETLSALFSWTRELTSEQTK